MNRKGSVILLVMIITAVCLPMLAFIWQTIFMQAKLNSNRVNTIQGELNFEREINRIMYGQEGVNNEIIRIIKSNPDNFHGVIPKFSIDIESNLLENISSEIIFSNEKSQKPNYKLKISGNYNGMKISKGISGSICKKELDDCENGLVYLHDRSEGYINIVEELLTLIPASIDEKRLPIKHSLVKNGNHRKINIGTNSDKKMTVCFDNDKSNCTPIFDNSIVLVVKSDGINKNSLVIDATGDPNNEFKMNGIIFIENGDIIFKGKSKFNGLIFIKEGEVKIEGEEMSTINGKVVINSYEDPREAVNIEYDSRIYFRYAKYLDLLLDPQIIKIEME